MPDFKTVHLKLNLKKEGKIPKHTDKIESILIKREEQDSQATLNEIQSESEDLFDMIDEIVTEITKKIEPDFIFTEDGDSFTFPYLIHRAEQNGINLIIGMQ